MRLITTLSHRYLYCLFLGLLQAVIAHATVAQNAKQTLPLKNTELVINEKYFTANGIYYLILQADGDLCVFDRTGNVVFSAYRDGAAPKGENNKAIMQANGNFCMYSAGGTYLWGSRTKGENNVLGVNARGELIVGGVNGKTIWNAREKFEVAATVYEHFDFGGTSQDLQEGYYDMRQLTMGNDMISSIKVKEGWKVTFYEHDRQGGDVLITSETIKALPMCMHDEVSSIYIERTNKTIRVDFRNPCSSQ